MADAFLRMETNNSCHHLHGISFKFHYSILAYTLFAYHTVFNHIALPLNSHALLTVISPIIFPFSSKPSLLTCNLSFTSVINVLAVTYTLSKLRNSRCLVTWFQSFFLQSLKIILSAVTLSLNIPTAHNMLQHDSQFYLYLKFTYIRREINMYRAWHKLNYRRFGISACRKKCKSFKKTIIALDSNGTVPEIRVNTK